MTRRRGLRYARKRLAGAILALFFGRKQGLPLLQPESLRRVLLIRYDRLGDMVITTPLLNAIRALAPQTEIDVLASPGNASIIRNDPRVANVIVWPKSLFARLRCIRECRKRGYDLVLQLILARTTLPAILAGLIANKGRTVGRYDPKNMRLLNHTVTIEGSRHFADLTTDVLSGGVAVAAQDLRKFTYSLHIPEMLRARAMESLKNSGLVPGTYALINISAADKERWLTAQQCVRLVELLVAQGFPVAIVGAPDHFSTLNDIAASVQHKAIPLQTDTIQEAAVYVEQAFMLVTPDTSIVHIATATQTPVVALYPSYGNPPGWEARDVPHINVFVEGINRMSELDDGIIADATLRLLAEINAQPGIAYT